MTGIRAVSFDLDGTLIDTAGEIAEAANRALADHGLPACSLPEVAIRIGQGSTVLMQALWQRAVGHAGEPGDAAALVASFEHHYSAVNGCISTVYPGVADALQRLRQGGVRLACTTNKLHGFSHDLLAAHGLIDSFDVLVGGDSLAFRKPDARVLQHVAEALGVGVAGLAHVGDSATDVRAARAAGALAWGVPWGYNGGEPIEAARPDRVFASLADLADLMLADGVPA